MATLNEVFANLAAAGYVDTTKAIFDEYFSNSKLGLKFERQLSASSTHTARLYSSTTTGDLLVEIESHFNYPRYFIKRVDSQENPKLL